MKQTIILLIFFAIFYFLHAQNPRQDSLLLKAALKSKEIRYNDGAISKMIIGSWQDQDSKMTFTKKKEVLCRIN